MVDELSAKIKRLKKERKEEMNLCDERALTSEQQEITRATKTETGLQESVKETKSSETKLEGAALLVSDSYHNDRYTEPGTCSDQKESNNSKLISVEILSDTKNANRTDLTSLHDEENKRDTETNITTVTERDTQEKMGANFDTKSNHCNESNSNNIPTNAKASKRKSSIATRSMEDDRNTRVLHPNTSTTVGSSKCQNTMETSDPGFKNNESTLIVKNTNDKSKQYSLTHPQTGRKKKKKGKQELNISVGKIPKAKKKSVTIGTTNPVALNAMKSAVNTRRATKSSGSSSAGPPSGSPPIALAPRPHEALPPRTVSVASTAPPQPHEALPPQAVSACAAPPYGLSLFMPAPKPNEPSPPQAAPQLVTAAPPVHQVKPAEEVPQREIPGPLPRRQPVQGTSFQSIYDNSTDQIFNPAINNSTAQPFEPAIEHINPQLLVPLTINTIHIHVPPMIKAKIWNNEFIEVSSQLSENKDSVNSSFLVVQDGKIVSQNCSFRPNRPYRSAQQSAPRPMGPRFNAYKN
ncbi:proteoglycan 4-like [Mercenaria mercenaria]|uniref:proteoglycan 4-like n=1 Tax=Mercenaria mercenaria TaxID=6596 RepID=UPI00234F1B74|nr:proteoglycan 4-like [Mercenaria mercenaria]